MSWIRIALIALGVFLARFLYLVLTTLRRRHQAVKGARQDSRRGAKDGGAAKGNFFNHAGQDPPQSPLVKPDASESSSASSSDRTLLSVSNALQGKRAMIVLGSGGHTSEMMTLLTSVPRDAPEKISFVIAATDVTSEKRMRAYDARIRSEQRQLRRHQSKSARAHSLSEDNDSDPATWGALTEYITIPRAREVGQSYFTSIFTTLYALAFSLWIVIRTRPHVIITNGPGTAVPICWAGFVFLRLLGFRSYPVILFVESYARVKKLSLTGMLLYPIASRFLVQWPHLAKKYPLTEYVGQLC